jgi:hypothetical protein
MREARLWSTALLMMMAAQRIVGEDMAATRQIAKSPGRLEATQSRPKAYGTEDYTVIEIPAVAFIPGSSNEAYFTSGSLGRYGPTNTVQDFYAPIELPPGVIIDYIGLNTTTDAPNAIGVALYRRFSDGFLSTVGELGSTVHDWATDYNSAPIGYQDGGSRTAYIVHVQQGGFPTLQFFGHVEVWFRLTVINPGEITFNDVPPEHPFYHFIGALASSGITAGCGGGNFCPDNPLTRGQMAVFLAKALGLHWAPSAP